MKIVSYNVNGIRAALNKGLAEWVQESNPDIIGLQEVKATTEQFDRTIFEDMGYELFWHPAVKLGYSGVAILSKIKPKTVVYGMDYQIYDDEGRIIRADFEEFSFISAYFPSGTTGDIRQAFKYQFLDDIYGYTQDLIQTCPNLIISGDYNICHKAIDIHNPISNKNSSGFLPEERAWMDKFTENGFVDTFRLFNREPNNYTWWSYRAGARKKNLGWRIDYQMVTTALEQNISNSSIEPHVYQSDHCPITINISI